MGRIKTIEHVPAEALEVQVEKISETGAELSVYLRYKQGYRAYLGQLFVPIGGVLKVDGLEITYDIAEAKVIANFV